MLDISLPQAETDQYIDFMDLVPNKNKLGMRDINLLTFWNCVDYWFPKHWIKIPCPQTRLISTLFCLLQRQQRKYVSAFILAFCSVASCFDSTHPSDPVLLWPLLYHVSAVSYCLSSLVFSAVSSSFSFSWLSPSFSSTICPLLYRLLPPLYSAFPGCPSDSEYLLHLFLKMYLYLINK